MSGLKKKGTSEVVCSHCGRLLIRTYRYPRIICLVCKAKNNKKLSRERYQRKKQII